MRILHTSDWHLGKKLDRIPRLPEQTEIMSELIGIVRDTQTDIVLLAGDIFDTFMPSGEAEELFYGTVSALSEICAAVVIPGNHDDAAKLCAASVLAERNGIFLLGDINCSAKTSNRGRIRLADAGRGFIKLTDGTEQAVIAYLPYPLDSRIGRQLEETIDAKEKYGARVGRWFSLGARAFSPDTINIGISHLFVAGSKKAGDEYEIELGTAKLIEKEQLPYADYTALGHVHKFQKVSSEKNAYYSGSILQYSFDDTSDKYALAVDMHAGRPPVIEKIPLTRGKKLIRLNADSLDAAEKMLEENSDKLVELTLTLPRPLSDSENKELNHKFPFVAKRRLILPETENTAIFERASRSKTEIFNAFYKSRKGGEPSAELTNLFIELMEESE